MTCIGLGALGAAVAFAIAGYRQHAWMCFAGGVVLTSVGSLLESVR